METQQIGTGPRSIITTETARLLNSFQTEAQEKAERASIYQYPMNFNESEFFELIKAIGTKILRERGESTEFVYDEFNQGVVRQLWLYSVRDIRFRGDLSKGVMIVGPTGTGKSLLMRSWSELITEMAHGRGGKVCKFIRADDLIEQYLDRVKTGIKWENWLLCVDEFGREARQANRYGNVEHPMQDLLTKRYVSGAITHGTSNHDENTILDAGFYGEMVADRLKSMFNFFVLSGESRRK